MCEMLQTKIVRLARKIDVVQKHTSKLPFLVDTNLGYLTLEGPGRQTGDTKSTSGLPLETWGYDSYVGVRWHQN